MDVAENRNVPYMPGDGARSRLLDVYQPGTVRPGMPSVLLWHGIGADERDVLAPLAREIAGRGMHVFVPDWRSDMPDGGRSHLLASLRYTQENATAHGADGQRIVLAGWSAGAGAAAGVALRPELFDGWRPAAVVGIAGDYGRPARTTGTAPLDDLAEVEPTGIPFGLIHGSGDSTLGSGSSRAFHRALRHHQWPAQFDEPDTDHAGVIMSEYDPALRRCRSTSAPHALRAGAWTARLIASAAAPPASDGASRTRASVHHGEGPAVP
ncbi:alpha/beta hydrolase [Streptomyces sp. NBC_00344]|uniref:alpha/beta hydrolase n=1 Tax=Streptomyces sp. NBC_00344 TaxID=2975720 RepID=UPI002E1F29F2